MTHHRHEGPHDLVHLLRQVDREHNRSTTLKSSLCVISSRNPRSSAPHPLGPARQSKDIRLRPDARRPRGWEHNLQFALRIARWRRLSCNAAAAALLAVAHLAVVLLVPSAALAIDA